jgi:hypothetical protein
MMFKVAFGGRIEQSGQELPELIQESLGELKFVTAAGQ